MMFPRYFILLSLIIACGTTKEFPRPSICNWVECPKYRLVKKYSGFEHREYDATQWISTPVTFNDEAIGASYINLFRYINGSNSAGIHLGITSPVVIISPLGDRESEKGSMSIFLSPNLKNPPMPLQSTNYLQSYPKASLYVRYFNGIPSEKDYAENIKALATELTELGLEFDDTFFACNIYDSLTKLSNRHNEVWFLAATD